jgi:hypothetical protein
MTLGAELERDRLAQRARRITAVIAALRRPAGEGRATHSGDRHIFQAIAEFEAELAAIDARLSDLAAGTVPAQERSDLPPGGTTT